MDLDLFQILSKYPFVFESDLFSTVELKQNKTCVRQRVERDCFSLFDSNTNHAEYNCSKGYNNILLIIGDLKFILNGLIYATNSEVPRGRKEARKEWIVNRDDVMLFADKISKIETHLIKRENETTLKNFSIFHDFKTSMKILYSCTEDIISNLPGETFEKNSLPVANHIKIYIIH